MKALAAAVLGFFIVVLGPKTARADDVAARTINPPNAPVFLQRCKASYGYEYPTFLNVENRTSHELVSFDVQYKVFDSEDTLIGQAAISNTLNAPLQSGDLQIYTNDFYAQLSEPASAISYVTCKIVAASFTGRHVWHIGQPWSEKLLPADKGTTSESSDAGSASNDTPPSPPKIEAAVLNAWADKNPTGGPGTYIHDHVRITNAAAGDATIYPQHFLLKMRLADGSSASFHGLAQSAPQYLKANYLTSQNQLVSQVDPAEDLGRLGSLAVPRAAAVETTVTFFVAQPLSDASDSRNVSYH